jgi:hypothetical protein
MGMITIIYCAEIVALLSVFFFQRKKHSARVSVLVIILLLVVIAESLTMFRVFPDHHLLIINCIIGLQMALYMFFYLSLMKKGKFGKFMIGYLIFFLIFWLLDSIAFQSITEELQTFVYIAGAAGVLGFILAYVHQDLLKTDRVAPPHTRFFLWISGALFFYLATELPVMAMLEYMIQNDIGTSAMPIFLVKYIVSFIYYATYPISLIWVRTV